MQPDQARGGKAAPPWLRLGPAAALLVALAVGSAMANEAGAPRPSAPAAPDSAPASVQPGEPRESEVHPVEIVLRYVDHIRDMPAAGLAQEARRLLDTDDSAIRLMQLAAALAQSRMAVNTLRAQALLHRVLGQDDGQAVPLHPLARLMSAQLADLRRADEQIERQSQQLRDAQRRIDQLTERLEAVRAIERSLPSPPPAAAQAAPAPRP